MKGVEFSKGFSYGVSGLSANAIRSNQRFFLLGKSPSKFSIVMGYRTGKPRLLSMENASEMIYRINSG